MPTISVIVPVYNVEAYLRRCVDSILAQTFTDFELILVDDGSPDNCPAICDEYAKQDSRVRVIHQANGGLSAARNAGIDWAFKNSDSLWLSFVDSDDWIHPEMLQSLYHAAIEQNVSVSACGYAETDGETPAVDSNQFQPQSWKAEDFFVERNTNATIACGKLYRKKCFAEVRYPVGKIHEDEYTTYIILFFCQKIAVIDAPLYFYFQNPNGITKSGWTPKRLHALEARKEQIAYFEIFHFKQAKLRSAKALLWEATSQIDSLMKLQPHEKQNLCNMRKLLRHELRKYKKVLALSPKKSSGLFEAAYPRLMHLFWLYQAFLRKLHLQKRGHS